MQSVVADSKRYGHDRGWDPVSESVVIPGLRVEFPARVRKTNGEADATIQTSGACAIVGNSLRVDVAVGITAITPPVVNRRTSRSRRSDVVFIDARITVIPPTAGNSIHTERRPVYAVNVVPVVGGQ